MNENKRKVIWLLVFGMFVCVLCIQPVVAEDEDPEEDSGNNLSLPVIWSDGITKPLRGTLGEPNCIGDLWYVWYEVIDGNVVERVCNPLDQVNCPPNDVNWVEVYPQRDPNNNWQAESLTLIPGTPLKVDLIDWGDNLEAKDWTDKAIIRTETVLYQDISAAPMTGYEMIWLQGLGVDEVWGTTLNTYQSDLATVYSGCARLTIQQLLVYPYDVNHAPIPNEELGLVWDVNHWDGDVNTIGVTYLNSVVWVPSEGQDYASYSSEVNVKGKIIYGYNWNTRKQASGPGNYRITFSLDGSNPDIALNTVFDPEVTHIVLVEEDPDGGSEAHNTTGGGEAVIDYGNNLTYIDVTLVPRRGGGGPGGGKEE